MIHQQINYALAFVLIVTGVRAEEVSIQTAQVQTSPGLTNNGTLNQNNNPSVPASGIDTNAVNGSGTNAPTPIGPDTTTTTTPPGFPGTGTAAPAGYPGTGTSAPPGYPGTGTATPPGYPGTGTSTPAGYPGTGTATPPGYPGTGSTTPPASKPNAPARTGNTGTGSGGR